MERNFFSQLKWRLKNYRLGMLASEVKNFVINTPGEISKLERRLISLKPRKPLQGHVLLCYINKGFFLRPGEPVPNEHTNNWESLEIANTFQKLGYQVDVISENNEHFLPTKHYTFFVGNRINFERIAEFLNKDCVKILHIDTAHWLFHNTAEHRRLLALQQRRGITLPTRRSLKPNLAIEHADYATILGNEFTMDTYRYANKPMYRVPISTPGLYPWPEDKDFGRIRKHFLWLSSAGFVHKGLDLVLEAFAEMSDYHLTVCGPLDEEKAFENAYYDLLYHAPNVHTEGWVDIGGSRFLELTKNCIGVIYPSCSEGGGGSLVGCMHAGLIPIVSREASVDVHENFGLVLKDCSIGEIKASVKEISGRPAQELKQMARAAWEFARANHTKENFAETYRKTISEIMTTLKEPSVPETATTRPFYQTSSSISDTDVR